MKPINAQELSRSYRLFVLNFILLTSFAILCVYLFFVSSKFEYQLLEKEVKQTDMLLAKRKEINTNFDMILQRFQQLSKNGSTVIGSVEMNNQAIILEDIQNKNFRIREIIKEQKSDAGSFQLYKKMTDDVVQMAVIQDSLLGTKVAIARLKYQLESCRKTNLAGNKKLKSGIFK
ncbi:hypothetical protein DBR43_06865 [Pedobacter sp. KBW06]|uniref:hypothetical protein n=1 Tax=Pedobacter sp. KBW06 TaxID=2153359 RepID=UPI000F5AB045|nr:hypothetical protein [Pedobacter sp. KBW06]RQO75088.1 hypothetical protein DBR43_06865 [Pedobacter sp. KBW06]